MMAALVIHTSSYMLLDKAVAQQIRNQAEQTLSRTAQNLSKLHEESLSASEALQLEHASG